MKIELVIAGLLEPDTAAVRAPALEALLARGRVVAVAAPDLDAWLLKAWGLPDGAAGTAAWCLLGEGEDPGRRHWLRMDPVHLVADRANLLLAPLRPGSLGADEAAALAATLRAHLDGTGAELRIPHPQRWYLGFETVPDLQTVSVSRAAGVLDASRLPGGEDSATWRRLLTEIQMLLHDHPVNAAREDGGRPAVNGVWLWGGPHAATACPPARGTTVWSDLPLARGIARAAGDASHPLPVSGRELLATGRRGDSATVVLDVADSDAVSIEREWVAPAHDALASGRAAEIRLWLLPPGRPAARNATRSALRKWWRRTRALARYA